MCKVLRHVQIPPILQVSAQFATSHEVSSPSWGPCERTACSSEVTNTLTLHHLPKLLVTAGLMMLSSFMLYLLTWIIPGQGHALNALQFL